MVESLFQPLNIFLLGLGGGFLIPLLYQINKRLPAVAFVLALAGMAVISGGLPVAAAGGCAADRDHDGRQRAAIFDQPALRPLGRLLLAQRQHRCTAGRLARLGAIARQLCGAVALPDPDHGHQRHGDDPRPVQPVRLPGDRVHRDLRAARASTGHPRRWPRASNTSWRRCSPRPSSCWGPGCSIMSPACSTSMQ